VRDRQWPTCHGANEIRGLREDRLLLHEHADLATQPAISSRAAVSSSLVPPSTSARYTHSRTAVWVRSRLRLICPLLFRDERPEGTTSALNSAENFRRSRRAVWTCFLGVGRHIMVVRRTGSGPHLVLSHARGPDLAVVVVGGLTP
jgi:hypothetical protein